MAGSCLVGSVYGGGPSAGKHSRAPGRLAAGREARAVGVKVNARAGPGHRKPLHFGHSAEIFDQLRRSACQVPAHGPPLQEPVPVLPDSGRCRSRSCRPG